MLVLSNRFECATASMTSTTSLGHGPRNSTVRDMSGCLLAAVLVEADQCITPGPLGYDDLAVEELRNRTDGDINGLGNLFLRHARRFDLGND